MAGPRRPAPTRPRHIWRVSARRGTAVTLASPLRADGRPQPASSDRDGAAIDARGGANNGATLNWPARARNASSSWLRRLADDGGNRRTTSSAASRNSAPCARRGRCVRLPARGGSAGGGGCSEPWLRRCWAVAGERRRSLPATSTRRSGGSWSSPRLSVEKKKATLQVALFLPDLFASAEKCPGRVLRA